MRADSGLAAQLVDDSDVAGIGDARVCVMLGDNWSENFYREKGLAFEYGRDTRNCLEQVAFDRADLFIHSSASSLATLNQSGLGDKVQMLPEVYSSVPLTLLVSTKSDVSAEFLSRFNDEVRRMEADGRLGKLIDGLLNQPWPTPISVE